MDMVTLHGVFACISVTVGAVMGMNVWKNALRKKWAQEIEADYEKDVERIVEAKELRQEEKGRLLSHLDMKRRIAERYHENVSYGGKFLPNGDKNKDTNSRYIQDRRFEWWRPLKVTTVLLIPSMALAMGIGMIVNPTMDIVLSVGATGLFLGGWGWHAWRRLKTMPSRKNTATRSQEAEELILPMERDQQTHYGWGSIQTQTYLEKSDVEMVLAPSVFVTLGSILLLATTDRLLLHLPTTTITLGILLPNIVNYVVFKGRGKILNPSKNTMRGVLYPREVESLMRIAPLVERFLGVRPSNGRQVLAQWLDTEVEDVTSLGNDLLRLYDVSLKIPEFEQRFGAFPKERGNKPWKDEMESEYETIQKEMRQIVGRMPQSQTAVSQDRRRIEQGIAILEDLLERENLDDEVRLQAEVTLDEARRRLLEEAVREGGWSLELKGMEQASIIDTVERSLDSEGWTTRREILPRKRTSDVNSRQQKEEAYRK